jgi:hypothetical protein
MSDFPGLAAKRRKRNTSLDKIGTILPDTLFEVKDEPVFQSTDAVL